MDRRELMIRGMMASAALPLGAATASAQQANLDPDKMPALLGGNYAVHTSRLALERATDPAARTFAQLEITEQEAVAMAFGAEAGVNALREDHAALVEQLQALEGVAFDRMYIDGQIAGHEELLGIHRTYAAQGSDPMARGASIVGVPAIESHLAMLRGIRNQIG